MKGQFVRARSAERTGESNQKGVNMKKFLALVLSLFMILSLAACGGSSTPSSAGENDEKESKTEAAKEDSKKDEETEESEKETEEKTEKETEKATEKETKKEMSFEETTLVDNDQITIIAKSIEKGLLGESIKVYLENKTDIDLNFTVDNAAINGVDESGSLYCTVTAGMKANDEISFYDVDSEIGDYTDIWLQLRVHDSNDWSADPILDEGFHLYPYGEENAVKYEREAQPSDIVLVDNDVCTVTVTGFEVDKIWGYTMNLWLVNKSGEDLTFSVSDTAVNGFMIDPFWATEIPAGLSKFSGVSWSDEKFEENGIEEVETLAIPLRVYSWEHLLDEDYVNETFNLEP